MIVLFITEKLLYYDQVDNKRIFRHTPFHHKPILPPDGQADNISALSEVFDSFTGPFWLHVQADYMITSRQSIPLQALVAL